MIRGLEAKVLFCMHSFEYLGDLQEVSRINKQTLDVRQESQHQAIHSSPAFDCCFFENKAIQYRQYVLSISNITCKESHDPFTRYHFEFHL